MLGLQVGSEKLGIGAGVPFGVSAAILIGGINDMATAQKLGARWTVRDPDGVVVDSYFDWAAFSTPPGQEHGFVGNQFSLDKLGTYTVKAELLMNPDDPVIVDSYDGDLCVVTTEVPPKYELLEETIYPYAYVYDGDVEASVFTFTTIPFTSASWIAGRLADAVKDQVEKDGGRIMEMRVYVDESLWRPWTNWRIDVVGIPPKTATGVALPVGITWWAVAILAALAIALIIVITWSIKTIIGSFTRKPLSEEIKETWSRETLISIIGDFEVKLERTPTPPEELEEMSDQELRDHCDQLAEVIVPPEVAWLPLVVVGGIAVLGVGAAVFALRGRK